MAKVSTRKPDLTISRVTNGYVIKDKDVTLQYFTPSATKGTLLHYCNGYLKAKGLNINIENFKAEFGDGDFNWFYVIATA